MELLKQAGVLAPTAISGNHKKQKGNRTGVQTNHRGVRPAQNMPPTTVRRPGSSLPALEVALNSAVMTAYLELLLLPIVQPERGLMVMNIELLDYKPGQRGLIRYELATAGGRERYTVMGKLYADPSQLARVDQVLHTLWYDVFGDDLHGSVPQPLGTIAELSMLVYMPAEGEFLDEVITSGRAAYAVELTAEWLSTLHRHPLALTKQFQLAGELTNLALWAEVVGQTYPELAVFTHQALRYLQQQAASLPLATQTPIHKDFHYRHVLVERGVKVIDFDELRLGDPNFDLAHFCANLHLLAYRQYGSSNHLRHLEHRFLDVYAHNTGWSLAGDHRARFTYFYVYTCLKIARQLCLGFGPGPVPTGEERRRQVHMILRRAAAAIAVSRG